MDKDILGMFTGIVLIILGVVALLFISVDVGTKLYHMESNVSDGGERIILFRFTSSETISQSPVVLIVANEDDRLEFEYYNCTPQEGTALVANIVMNMNRSRDPNEDRNDG